jgi:hypothetical protein
MPLSTIFQYRGGQFYWWRTPEDPEKTTDLSQITDKLLSHNVVHLALIEIELTTVVIGTDCTGSCKSKYDTITATMAPYYMKDNMHQYCVEVYRQNGFRAITEVLVQKSF